MKQIDFVDQVQAEADRKDKEQKDAVARVTPPAASPEPAAPAAPVRRARRKTTRSPARPPRKNRPAGSREDLQRLNMEVPRALHKRLKLKAIYEDRTVTDIVLQAIHDYLNSH